MNFVLYPQFPKKHRTLKSLQSQHEARVLKLPSRPVVRMTPRPELKPKDCQWIEGDPKQRMFCGALVQGGSSYCPEHHARCYSGRSSDSDRAIVHLEAYLDWLADKID